MAITVDGDINTALQKLASEVIPAIKNRLSTVEDRVYRTSHVDNGDGTFTDAYSDGQKHFYGLKQFSDSYAIATANGSMYQSSGHCTITATGITTIHSADVQVQENSYRVYTAVDYFSGNTISFGMMSGLSRTGKARTASVDVWGV